MKIKVTKELLEKCIKDVDVEEQGENCKLILRFTDNTTDDEAEAISDYFENIYKYIAMMLGISEDELNNICEMVNDLNNTKDDYNIDNIIDNLFGMQNNNINNKLKKLDNINEPSKEELDKIENEKENKIIDISKYRKR